MVETLQFVNYRRELPDGPWRAGRLSADGVIDSADPGRPQDTTGAGEPAIAAAAAWAASGTVPAGELVTAPVEIGTPVLKPGKIIAAAGNYLDHTAEMPEDRGTIERQGFFLKAPTSLLPPGGTVLLPVPGRRTDYEGELAVVIGKRARFLSEEDALDAVLGYTCLVDVSLRGEEDRGYRKSFDTFTPLGTGLVPRDCVPDLAACKLTTLVNGEIRQQAALSQMVYGVPRLLAWISSVMTLLPGDVIATGTPQGVGPLEPGDAVSVQISGISTVSVTVASR
jgi:2-keto-4-pentenoate hydratase/2-oxohepta-3-ene-1,7-dioic acid hydratase in catechol pathway